MCKVTYVDNDLHRLEREADFTVGYPAEVIKFFRKRMQLIRSLRDERDFCAMPFLCFEKLNGSRSHLNSIRLMGEWRLVFELQKESGSYVITVYSIEAAVNRGERS